MIYSVIDVETTGLSATRGDRVLEIGIARLMEDGSIEPAMDTLVNPDRPVTATRVHGITDGMVADAPRFRDLIPLINDVLDGTIIAAHNASFDLSFLREEFRRGGTGFSNITPACTLIMARRYLSHLPSRSLESCRNYLGISDEGAHNALADAISAARLLRHFLDEHQAVPIPEIYRSPHASSEPSLFGPEENPTLKPREPVGGRY